MKKKKTKNKIAIIFFFGIILLGFTFRFIKFSNIPVSLNRDELALGYNAFALASEGKDEWGQSWPITFKSFGDYKLPGYIYLLIPFVKLFGLTDFAIRLPSLIAGIINIWLIFLIAKKTFPKQPLTPFFAALMLALMPWAIHYSRIGFEAQVGLSFTLATIYLLISSQKSKKLSLLAPLTLMAAMLTYNSPLLLSPFILLSYIFLFYSNHKKHLLISFASLLLFVVAIFIAITSLLSVSQAKTGIIIFTDPTLNYFQREARLHLSDTSQLLASVFANKYVFFSKVTIQNYLKTFSPIFLLTQGGQHSWHSIPNWAHFTYTQYGLFFLGLIIIISKYRHKLSLWLLFLLLIGPMPAAITVDAPHTTRSLLFLSLAALPIAVSLTWIYQQFCSKKYLSFILILIVLAESTFFLKDYLFTYPQKHGASWKTGLKQAIFNINSYPTDLPVYITDYQSSPYIYVLFYQQILPSQFLPSVKYYPPDNAGLIHVKAFTRYHFVSDKNQALPQSLLIDTVESGQMVLTPF